MSSTKQSKKPSTNGRPALGETLFALRPDPVDATAGSVQQYLEALHNAAAGGETDPLVIRVEAWEQIAQLRSLFGRDREATSLALANIYANSPAPSAVPTGLFRGMVVAPIDRGIEGRALRFLTNLYLPWIGKRFDDEPGRGINVLRRNISPALKLIWPSHTLQQIGASHIGIMPFKASLAASVVDAGKQVLKLDYNLAENPKFQIRDTVDELVEVVPGTLLGKMTVLRGRDYKQLAYFALRRDAP